MSTYRAKLQGMDFAPMPRRRQGALSSILSQVSDGVAEIETQREPHAQFWDEWNAKAIAADGPLWIALGDSSSQGVGAPDPADGWVPRMADRLRSETGDLWRVINLSITGAQYDDITAFQLDRVRDLQRAGQHPELMSLIAGANNLMAPNSWPEAFEHLDRILAYLPAGRSVVARVGASSTLNSMMARRFNARIEAAAIDKDFQLFWPWAWPSKDGLAVDNWHPGPKGYGYMVDLIWPGIAKVLASTD